MSREVLYYKASKTGKLDDMIPVYHTGPWLAFRIIAISSWIYVTGMNIKFYIEDRFTEEEKEEQEESS